MHLAESSSPISASGICSERACCRGKVPFQSLFGPLSFQAVHLTTATLPPKWPEREPSRLAGWSTAQAAWDKLANPLSSWPLRAGTARAPVVVSRCAPFQASPGSTANRSGDGLVPGLTHEPALGDEAVPAPYKREVGGSVQSLTVSSRPVRRVLQLEEQLAGLGHEQYAFVLAAGEFFDPNAFGIAIAQVDATTDLR